MKDMFSVYSFNLCPFSRQVRLFLKEMNINFQLIEEKYWEYDVNFLKINPASDVPVLIDQDNNIISSKYAILEYLIEINDSEILFSNDILIRAEIRRLINWFNEKFYNEVSKPIINERIIGYYQSHNEPNSDMLRAARINLSNHLDYTEYLLNERKWICNEKITLADIVAASHFSVLDYLGNVNWKHHSLTKEWYSVMKSRPSFRDILSDRILGFVPAKHYNNLDF